MTYEIISPHEQKENKQTSFFKKKLRGKKNARDIPALWMRDPDNHPQLLEIFRTFANKIVLFNDTQKLKVFLMTGINDKTGTSTITFNLGLIMGRGMPDRQILIIDTNFESPSLHLAFNHAPSNGLMEYLLEGAALTDIVQCTFLPNLDIITFSQLDNEILSPFSQPSFKRLLDEVRDYYDIILLDSAPALQSSHTKMISSKVDGVILVVEANKTRFEVLEECVNQLNIQGANILGSFLNKRKYFIPQWIYRYIF